MLLWESFPLALPPLLPGLTALIGSWREILFPKPADGGSIET
jgi:hypothetical protein